MPSELTPAERARFREWALAEAAALKKRTDSVAYWDKATWRIHDDRLALRRVARLLQEGETGSPNESS